MPLPNLPILIIAGSVVAVMLVFVWMVRRSRLRRRKLRAFDPCERCGFDLRATTGPCPECGRARKKRRVHRKPGTAGKDELFDDFVDEQFRPG